VAPIVPREVALKSYLKEIARYNPLSSEEEASLAERIRKGDKKALARLVKANLRFVVSVARTYEHQGLPLSELINEGNLGLLRAAERYDGRKNFRFISYAVWWIRQAILQALADGSRLYRVPLTRIRTLYRVSKTVERLEQKYHRPPCFDEVAREAGVKAEDVEVAYGAAQWPVKLDKPVRGHAGSLYMDLVTDRTTRAPDRDVLQDSAHSMVVRLLHGLREREREVVRLYYGIGENTTYTLEEIGCRLNLTRERVRQIKGEALRRLRETARPEMREVFAMEE
jgi:RNA polymerase primary sigma factor